jgi:tRNA modification GTPase
MTKILETVIKYGARCAKPGEFTKRAFLNGRIDLSKAEAVMDIINSKNELALKNSISQLKGSVYQKLINLREKILFEIAFIESALDDPEHISLEGYSDKLQSNITKLIEELDILLKNFKNGKILKEGVRTVILGKPNAGKSSLLNLLIGEEKAIVTDIAGTTRDAIEETINLNGVVLNLIDTAGIRETEDIVEKIGVERSLNFANQADLIIFVVDASKPLDENDFHIMNIINDTNVIILINKTDLIQIVNEEDIRNRIDAKIIPISAKNNLGINLLEDTIKNMFYHNNISFNDEIIITSIRQKDAIEKANESCKFVLKSIQDHMPEDFYSIDLMSAYSSLGEVIGEEVDEDLVNKIFSEFCTGK